MTKLDRVARPLLDAKDIVDERTLRGKPPELSKTQEAHWVSIHLAGTHTTIEIAELSGVARSTAYRAIHRAIHRAGGPA